MRAKLTALLAGAALFGLVGVAQADVLTPTGTQLAKSTETQLVTLTDAQLDDVTAGRWYDHGFKWFRFYAYGRFWQYYARLWIWNYRPR
jgi:hypothetical protein